MKFKVGDVVRIVSNVECTHYAVVPSVGVVLRVLYLDKYDVECVSRLSGCKTTQTVGVKDLASSKAAIL